YPFSVSRFHVPQGRPKIAQRFIAGLWREHKTSPVRDERTHRSSPVISVAPPGLRPFSTLNPRLKPWAILGRPYRDFGIRALQSFNIRRYSSQMHAYSVRLHFPQVDVSYLIRKF